MARRSNAVTKQAASTFDERDQLQTETTTGAGAGTLALGYDANGALTTTTKDLALQSTRAYDARGRLAELRDGTGAIAATYRYTADGVRAGQTEGPAATGYLVDALSPSGYAQVVEERTAAGVTAQFAYGLGLDPVSMSRDLDGTPASLEPALYLADGHGGVRQAVDLAGGVLAAYRYDAFGAKVSDAQRAGGLANPVGYRGERYDATLGNYNLRARHYDPRAGRFTSMDPFAGNYGDVLQAMRYGYAGANPIANADPSGREFSVGGLSAGLGIGLAGFNLGSKIYNGGVTGDDFVGFGLAISDALGCKGVAAFRSMMGLPFGVVLGAAVGFYGGFLAGFADALADDPNVSYDKLMDEAITEGIIGAIEGIMAFAYLGRAGACFTAGTPLLTTEGSKAIEQLQVGDLVLARDEHDPLGPVEAKLVEEVFVRYARVLYLTVGDQRIGTTNEHPFYVCGRGWTSAGDLIPGDVVVSHDGQDQTVQAKEPGEWQTVYNLRVQDYHTYFVGCEEWGFSAWAHNAYAIVYYYPPRTFDLTNPNPHLSIKTKQKTTVHTDRVYDPRNRNATSVQRVSPSDARHATQRVPVSLDKGGSAKAQQYQLRELAAPPGPPFSITHNCFTHVSSVLRAGGSRIGSGFSSFYGWLQQTFGYTMPPRS